MELTKKEFIEKLKKELDLIEVRYQHLLNENSMIGEDFRSRACENLNYAKSLEDKIKKQNEEMADLNNVIDRKDLDIVGWGRTVESYKMNLEEYLTYHEIMKTKRDELQIECDNLIQSCTEKDLTIADKNE